jgi:hypothetical protein
MVHCMAGLLRWAAGAIALLVLAAGLAADGSASPDRTPPTFAGLRSATACIPGPVEAQTATYRLDWDQAQDGVTPSTQIVYDIYQATKSGGEDFSSPTYTARHGATTFTTPPLPADQSIYFVVRARDRAGNRDSNTVERSGANICV